MGHDHHGHEHGQDPHGPAHGSGAVHDHDHHHDHDHGAIGHIHVHVAPGVDPRSALVWALALNGGFLLIEAGVGWFSGSLALLSDAAHMVSDVGALVLALAAATLAQRSATAAMTYGLRRAEVLGAFVNGLALLVACAWIAWEAVGRLIGGAPEVPGWPVLLVGVVGLAINLGSAWALWRSAKGNLNIQGALAHMLADALGSLGAIVAAGLLFMGWQAADAWISLLTAALVVWGAWRVLRASGRVLLELPPAGTDVVAVRDALLQVHGVAAVHDLHVWSLDGTRALVSAHLVLSGEVEGMAACSAAHARLTELGIHHVTLQVESGAGPCVLADCGEGAVAV